ncbi:dipeptidase PepE [Flavobacterium sp. NST-5]|uniref:Dipeptidase PepE n=1 Tax=Flavobacterium ichthyis TaxID=2698827 RepID=A0ABW9ZBM6_9FLAO|nr:dipeptidase PepE [Flavobacterium ichthyis]NBL64722.1 dipeptidase PepE [Flavobacterium ichthyis]
MKNLIVASTSTLHGENYLAYLFPEIEKLFQNCDTILFIPFARPNGISHDEYTQIVSDAFSKVNKKIQGLHAFSNKIEAIEKAQGIFVGGGNTFVLLTNLYHFNLLDPLKTVIENGTPYLGTSAGSNITGLSIKTTNDMPIVYPPSFDALQILNFNLNPHYLDPLPGSTHMGETRETRINEFHTQNNIPVLGLREGSWLRVTDNKTILEGNLTARLFTKAYEPKEISPKTNLADLIS